MLIVNPRPTRGGLAALLVLLCSACSVSLEKLATQQHSSETSRCEAFYRAFAHRTEELADPASHRIPQVAWLRTNRTLAAKARQLLSRQYTGISNDELLKQPQWQQWLNAAATFAASRQRLEWRRLNPTEQQQLLAVSQQTSLSSAQRYCRSILEPAWLATPKAQLQLKRLSKVPDNYSTAKRFLGFYPITQWGTRVLLPGLKKEFLSYFAKHPEQKQQTAKGQWQIFSSTAFDSSEEDAVTKRQDNSAELSESHYFNITQEYNPVWRINVASQDDIPGTLKLTSESDQPSVAGQPSEYQYLSETWFDGAWRLQVNYVIWFPRRTAHGVVDLLAGEIDSLVWRVTLDDQNQPMVYDSIHSCGCYHLVIPTAAYQQREVTEQWPEPPLVMPALQMGHPSEKLELSVASGSHYLVGVNSSDSSTHQKTRLLNPQPYENLLALSVDNRLAQKSAFDTHGLVAGSQRPERWLLWPMGIRSAGAMRQVGTQAIAFVGRRHFDDWSLLDQILEPINP